MDSCIVCGSNRCDEIVRTPALPLVANQLGASRSEALTLPRAPVRLLWCTDCDHVFNTDFDPHSVDYRAGYENAQHFSPRFREYLHSTIERLAKRYALRGRHAVEIGCGDGYFLALLHRELGMSGVGYDPAAAVPAAPSGEMGPLVAERVDAHVHRSADFVCGRHVLEHVAEPIDFLATAFDCLRDSRSIAYIEVPSGSSLVRERRIWELIYEHVSYFTPRSLDYAMRRAGFALRARGSGFGEQFLWVEAGRTGQSPECGEPHLARSEIEAFASGFTDLIEAWATTIERTIAAGRRIVLWGAGSKGVSFLNMVGDLADAMPSYIVDVNPRKIGRFVPGTGQRVVAPQFLDSYRPDVVIVLNSQYAAEIQTMLLECGLGAELMVV